MLSYCRGGHSVGGDLHCTREALLAGIEDGGCTEGELSLGLATMTDREEFLDESEALWGAAEPVECAGFKRSKDTQPHLKGNFIITSLVETCGADGIAEYNGSLKVCGTPTVYPGKPTEN